MCADKFHAIIKTGSLQALSYRCLHSSAERNANMNILVVDGQGGGIGRQVISALKSKYDNCIITAVGTNSLATGNMLKAGADEAATGENAVITMSRRADIIIGPVGIVIADSLLGEITPAMAAAAGQSSAKRILIPMNHCDNIIVGVPDLSTGKLIEYVTEAVGELL